jgi:O-antigen/teichoic acid export membrane protein
MAAFALYYRIDMVMLEWLAAPGELGRYAAAYRFLDAVVALAASLGGPLFPRLASVAASAPAEVRRLLEAGWRPLLALGLPLTIGTLAVADDLVAALFGPEFNGVGRLLRLLILGTLPLFWVNIASHALVAADRVWAIVGVYALSALVNVVANLVVVPRWGAAGAAAATVACEWLNLALVVRLLRAGFGVQLSAAGLWRYVGAVAAMLMAVVLARPLGVVVTVALAATAYALALWALGYTRSADHLLVKRLLVEQPRQ